MTITEELTARAQELGFRPVGIAPAAPFTETRAAARARLKAGHLDGMAWYTASRVERGTRPDWLLSEARSIVSLALPYYVGDVSTVSIRSGEPHGVVSRYAWGRDYHNVLRKKLKALVSFLESKHASARFFADTGPILDRAAAFRAGVGWYGKSTMILTEEQGTWVFLAEIITDLKLEYSKPLKKTCGSCTRCIDACPTGAIVAPYQVDARRCIAYLTIENRGGIPREFRSQIGTRVFGCDICQDVCPVNRYPEANGDEDFLPRPGVGPTISLLPLLEISEEEFQRRFQGTPLMRAKRQGLRRNAIVALGNAGDPAAIPALRRVLLDDEEAAVLRGHAAWALGRFRESAAKSALRQSLEQESPPEVRAEVEAALRSSGSPESAHNLQQTERDDSLLSTSAE
ncbi:MAG: tRNA epoxyqueuosine(34) reductase QueG [Chloroflexota bacterium]|nr:tRNA epoxyqueuosine(34) reductase QueG [Chloroflexota bacterium]MDE2930081.1 tRNA epoxyqueuosine(34) reductase QueG [Chloroflexota bacterium]